MSVLSFEAEVRPESRSKIGQQLANLRRDPEERLAFVREVLGHDTIRPQDLRALRDAIRAEKSKGPAWGPPSEAECSIERRFF